MGNGKTGRPFFSRVTYQAVLICLTPLVLTLVNMRLLLTPLFPLVEYNLPGFPSDPYGFSRAERIYWAGVCIDYLLNDEGIEFLADLYFPEGQMAPAEACAADDCRRLFNERELAHMADVKHVTRWLLILLGAALLASVLAGMGLQSDGEALRAALRGGAVLTLALVGGLVAAVLLAWGPLFTQFHRLFFAADTWIFPHSNTLIRLFPVRFWQDTFMFVGGAAAVEALMLAWVARRRRK